MTLQISRAPRVASFSALLLAGALALPACDVDQTQEGEMPEVDVDVEEGRLPSYDVEWADVDVGLTEETVEVPKLRVVMEEETVSVPFVDVTMPDEMEYDGPTERRVIRVSAQVPSGGYEIDIESMRVLGDTLYVISELEGEPGAGDREVISDTVVVRAPELDLRHIIIGEKPPAAFNDQYKYVPTEQEAERIVSGGTMIYDG